MTRWLDEREQRAWRGYLAMQAQLQARLHRRLQADSGLSYADFDVLVALTDRAGEQVRVLELAEALQWEKSRLSHHLSRMQKRGLVEREECADDARGAFVVLTAEGRRAIEGAAPAHVEAVRELMFDGLDADQVDALAGIAETVLGRIRAAG
ncbi:MarR family transcriptional regulator [Pseudonocardia kujensis]|uniref:MarR family winged helix-turn-helix transcriptional regulator n=1 Tax=Pseudonocardia kujensis TaxID=1128675 RepID=UPI001E4B9210|nr:MarR family transcriptional regulator [Pseudonocardia kujensis]MCE0764421.1 MarR family transcriptional regulator [Pseudonocardia kujensis]